MGLLAVYTAHFCDYLAVVQLVHCVVYDEVGAHSL